jgi:hypothetical protein
MGAIPYNLPHLLSLEVLLPMQTAVYGEGLLLMRRANGVPTTWKNQKFGIIL